MDETLNAALPKSRHRWYQFNLRTLLIVVTLLGTLVGVVGEYVIGSGKYPRSKPKNYIRADSSR